MPTSMRGNPSSRTCCARRSPACWSATSQANGADRAEGAAPAAARPRARLGGRRRTARRFYGELAYLRFLLRAGVDTVEDLMAASIGQAYQLFGRDRDFMMRAGRVVARLLAGDHDRLMSVLELLSAEEEECRERVHAVLPGIAASGVARGEGWQEQGGTRLARHGHTRLSAQGADAATRGRNVDRVNQGGPVRGDRRAGEPLLLPRHGHGIGFGKRAFADRSARAEHIHWWRRCCRTW